MRGLGLACVDDLPAELRALGRRIPAEILVVMTPREALARCEYVNDLLGRAQNERDDKAARIRRLAEQVLKSIDDRAYDAEVARLNALSVASGGYAGGGWLPADAVRSFVKRNPRVPAERLLAAAVAEGMRGSVVEPRKRRMLRLPWRKRT